MSMLQRLLLLLALVLPPPAAAAAAAAQQRPTLFPASGAREVNPDTPLRITLAAEVAVGASGTVRIYDTANNRLVDMLDLAIPVSPNPEGRPRRSDGATRSPTPPAPAGPDNSGFQYTKIGDAFFHFFPVRVAGRTATIRPHHGALAYGRTYRVQVDGPVIRPASGRFTGISGGTWTFSTKAAPPSASVRRVTVSAEGRGDFSTVQGAIDFVPPVPKGPVEIFIRNGRYDEIVYLKGKSNLTIRGESRDGVVVGYPNNSAFNRIRPAFSIVEANDIQLSTFTINNYFTGQAEALLVRGERNIVDRMTLNGSGDALQTHGSLYMVDSSLTGDGDTILGYATLFCLRCTIRSVGPFTWTRTPQGRHGNVFVDSTFLYLDKPLPWSITPSNPAGTRASGVFARLPRNGAPSAASANFPFAEMVLIDAKTEGVPPVGWGPVQDSSEFDWSNLRLWEYNTMDLNGRPADLSQRHPASRLLDEQRDASTIANYRRAEWVLGWRPVVRTALRR